jgi:hypothetical protein
MTDPWEGRRADNFFSKEGEGPNRQPFLLEILTGRYRWIHTVLWIVAGAFAGIAGLSPSSADTVHLAIALAGVGTAVVLYALRRLSKRERAVRESANGPAGPGIEEPVQSRRLQYWEWGT